MYRQTYNEINLSNIRNNIKKIINKYNNYNYYFGVVKADAYGHSDLKVVKEIINGGCNYLAVSSLDEALRIRKHFSNIPILCLEPIPLKYIKKCYDFNITITISSKEYLSNLLKINNIPLKVHLKIDTGMNRLGIKTIEECEDIYKMMVNSNCILEGIYTHIYYAENKELTLKQIKRFKEIIDKVKLNNIPIIHFANSETLVRYPKPDFVNGARLGIIMYGFTSDKNLKLESTFSVINHIIEIKKVKKGETIGYNGIYKAKEDILIGIVPIGYADGIIRANTGRMVFINNKEYKIVGNVCMDMLMVEIDDSVRVDDKVYVIKDVKHIEKIAKHTNTIPYETICLISKRVPKKYRK